MRLMRLIFLWVGLTIVAVSLSFSTWETVGFGLIAMALVPDD